MDTIFLSQITFNDDERQRRKLTGIEELAASIASVGLIQPPVITRDFQLIAGRRRIEAMTSLGWIETPVLYRDEVDPALLQLLELEENVKRVNLTWQEQVEAVVRYHNLRRAAIPEWTAGQTAVELSMSPTGVGQALAIIRTRDESPDLKIMEVENYSTARGLATRSEERKRGSEGAAALLGGTVLPAVKAEELLPEKPVAPKVPEGPYPRKAALFNADFTSWVGTTTARFNLLHCDFPYGVNTGDKTEGQSATKRLGTYDDSEKVYWNLLDFLEARLDEIVMPEAHLVFWFSMKHYDATKARLVRMGWKLNPFLLIWHKSDNTGIIPDPNRGGRNTYETAFFGSRGDRKIVRPLAMSFSGPTTRSTHPHEKSVDMLQHFFGMLVDDSTFLLDPTCGSGSAVKAAEARGAKFAVGLERDPEFWNSAMKNLGLKR